MPRFTRHAVCSPLTLASRIGLDVLRGFRILIAGQTPDDAIAAPRWTFDRTTLAVEDGLVVDAPPGMTVGTMAVSELAGHAHAILVGPGVLDAACDPRSDGVAVGE